MHRTILLNPGPVTLSDTVREAMVAGDWCHREPEFADLTRWINDSLVRVYPSLESAFESVILTGSGTCAVEAMLTSFAPDSEKTLVVANGVYGERMARMLEAHGKPHVVVRSPATSPMDLEAVQQSLRDDDSIKYVAAVHHETTTGRLNDLEALGSLCREAEVKLMLDAVSSFGAEEIDADGWNIAALAATANKCLHGVPGISFVLAEKTMWASPNANPGSVYLNLFDYYKPQHTDGYSPFTQSVQSAFALRVALQEFFGAGGWSARRALYVERADTIHAALAGAGIDTLLPVEDFSCVLRSYRLPENVSYSELHDHLKELGYVIYAGQGKLAASIFRIANMGDIRSEEIDTFCNAITDFAGSATS